MISDQKHHWNKLHSERSLNPFSNKATEFAEKINGIIPSKSTILELGCGVGNDSAFLASNHHYLTSTDFSDVVISANKQKHQHLPNLKFKVVEISKTLPFNNHTFDVVYARLSLHYFTNQITKQLFKELSRVLRPNGLLCFMCKTTKDP